MYNVFVLCIVIYCNSVEINIHSFIHIQSISIVWMRVFSGGIVQLHRAVFRFIHIVTYMWGGGGGGVGVYASLFASN